MVPGSLASAIFIEPHKNLRQNTKETTAKQNTDIKTTRKSWADSFSFQLFREETEMENDDDRIRGKQDNAKKSCCFTSAMTPLRSDGGGREKDVRKR